MKQKLESNQIDQIVDLYERNNSTHDISRLLSISSNTILRYLRLRDVQIRNREEAAKEKRKRLNSAQEQEVSIFFIQGQKSSEIAERFQVSTGVVYRILKEFYGYKFHRKENPNQLKMEFLKGEIL